MEWERPVLCHIHFAYDASTVNFSNSVDLEHLFDGQKNRLQFGTFVSYKIPHRVSKADFSGFAHRIESLHFAITNFVAVRLDYATN